MIGVLWIVRQREALESNCSEEDGDSGPILTMAPILFLSRRMTARPALRSPPELTIRNWRGDTDIAAWLALHRAAFPAPRPELRQWEEGDLRRELLSRSAWSADRTWFALDPEADQPIGMISLLPRAGEPADQAHLQWLVVAPAWRRRGIARQLLVTAEQAAWEAGYRVLALETLSAWKDAVAFYEANGYRPRP